jgi:hypothetical protein
MASDADRKRDELNDDSQDLLKALERLKATESDKRQEPISSPRFHDLAEDIVQQSRDIFSRAYREDRLGDDIPTGDATLDDVEAGAGGRSEP